MKGKARRLLSWVCVLALCMSLLLVTALAAGDGSSTTTVAKGSVTESQNGVTVNKSVSQNADGSYQLTMEAWAQNKVTSSTTATPLDIVLVLDMSGSMDDTMGVVTEYTSTGSQDWSYGDIGYHGTTYYYKAEDGNYYRVRAANFGDRENPEYALTYGTSEWNAKKIPE